VCNHTFLKSYDIVVIITTRQVPENSEDSVLYASVTAGVAVNSLGVDNSTVLHTALTLEAPSHVSQY